MADYANFEVLNEYNDIGGGAGKSATAGFKKTQETYSVKQKNGKSRSAVVYQGPRGGKYILRKGKMVPVPKK